MYNKITKGFLWIFNITQSKNTAAEMDKKKFSTRPQTAWRRQTEQVRSSDETSGGGARSYLTSLTSLTLRTFSTRPHTAWRRQRVKVRSSDETSGGGARSYLTSLTSLTLRTRVRSYSLGQCLIHVRPINSGVQPRTFSCH